MSTGDEELPEPLNAVPDAYLALVRMLTHELRTPLSSIIGFADMMENEMLGPLGNSTYLEYSHDIHRAARTILDVLNDVTEPARFHAFAGEDGDFRHLIELAPDLICMCRDGAIEMINPAGAGMLGVWPVQTLMGRHLIEFMDDEDASTVGGDLSGLVKTQLRRPIRLCRPDKVIIDVEVVGVPYFDDDGNDTGSIMVVARDVTERNRAVAAVAEREANLRLIMDSAGDGIVALDEDGTIIEANPAAEAMFGRPEDLVGRNIKTIIPSLAYVEMKELADLSMAARESFDIEHGSERTGMRRDGTPFPVAMILSASRASVGPRYVAVIRDATARKSYEDRLRLLATRDTLTGLANRNLLTERLQDAIDRARSTGIEMALVYCDLDQFQNINDAFGHEVGDEVIKLAAQRVQACAPPGATVARVGGDEFHILVPDVTDKTTVEGFAATVLKTLSQPFVVQGREIFSSVSIGVGFSPSDATTVSELLRNVDTAANNAKRDGRANCKIYIPKMSEEVHRRVELGHHLRRALDNDELSLAFQAKVDLASREIIGAEALLRWQSAELGFVSPAEFVPIAEETGLIVPIGQWVLERACRQATEWPTGGPRALQVGVNLSALQFSHGNLVERVASSLEESGLPASRLDLELTESLLVERPEETIRTLNELKEMGISISMDDFGTGYSSLAYLTRFPLDSLKVDRAFVTDLPHDRDAVVVVRAIVVMAQQLEFHIVAEGIETERQMEFLHGLGCHTGQGYFFSKPLPNDEFIGLLSRSAAE